MTGKMIDGSIETYVTDGGITVSRSRHKIIYEGAMERSEERRVGKEC